MTTKQSLAWMGWAQACSFALQFGSTIILARYLSPYETGIYSVAMAVLGVLSLIQALGLQALIVREAEVTRELRSTAFTVNALISVILSLLIVCVSVWGGAFLRDHGVQRILFVLAINPLFAIFYFLPSAYLEREGRFKEMALIGTFANAAGALTTIVFAMLGFSYMSVAYAQCVTGFINLLLMLMRGRRHISIRLSFTSWRRVAEFGFQMLAVSGINAMSTKLSDVALGRIVGLEGLGYYSRASGLNNLIWTNIHLAIGRVMFVDFAKLSRSGISLRDRYLRTLAIITAVMWPAFAGLGLIARPFIQVVYGAKWVPAAIPLIFLAAAAIVLVASSMTWELFAATGRLRVQTRIEFIRAFFALGAFAVGCAIGLWAAAAARVVDAIIAYYLYRPHINRMTDTTARDFLPIFATSALLTIAAVAPAGALMTWTRWSAATSLWMTAGSVILGMLFWLGGLALVGHPLLDEMRIISKSFANRLRAA